jgi:arsenite/tail-anchored protein-transporting ATPase
MTPTRMTGLIEQPPRFLFFTGKGGVGKTSLACATAVALADRGLRVLLVSTDPASNLEDVLETRLSGAPTPVPGATSLWALDIDPEAAAREYRERTVGPYRGVLPAAMVREMEEQLSGACTLEVAAFDRFVSLLAGAESAERFDHVVFDTAPTGHTLRLLQLPAAWDRFLSDNTTGASCLGPLSALGEKRGLYKAAVEALADGERTALVLVARAEETALAEAERTRGELSELGVAGQWLAINGVLADPDRRDPVAASYAEQGVKAVAAMPEGLAALPREEVPLRPFEIQGVGALRALLDGVDPEREAPPSPPEPPGAGLVELVDELGAAGHGLVMVMGKGGVGKTTIATAIAVELARRGLPVHLTTTDPAAHLAATLAEEVPGLEVSRIDPREETRRYTEHVLATTGKGLDAAGRALLEEDLRSPCTERGPRGDSDIWPNCQDRLMNESARLSPTSPAWRHRSRVLKALGHPTRLFLVDHLSRGERCVCELTSLVAADVSTVSRHLGVLRQAGILADERRGAQVFYRLVAPAALELSAFAERVARNAAARDRAALTDLAEAAS